MDTTNSPYLQPIELFWAAGKNHAASLAYSRIKMRQTINHLCEGWYGNLSLFQDNQGESVSINNYEIQPKEPVDCNKIFRNSIKMANEKLIPMCEGISGCIGYIWLYWISPDRWRSYTKPYWHADRLVDC
jgi:hypothetical protein